MRTGVRIVVAGLILATLGWGNVAEAQSRLAISSVSPETAAAGAEVTIGGRGFGSNRRAVRVTLGGRQLPIRSVTPTQIRFTVPPGSTSGSLVVNVGTSTVTYPRPFTVAAPLRVIGFSPTSGGPGTEVTIRGAGFRLPPNENRVVLTGVECRVVGGSATELRIQIPARGIRTGTFEVITRGGPRARSTGAFTVVGAPTTGPTPTGQGRPVIERFEPLTGPPGTVVRIIGRNFSRRINVSFGGRTLPIIDYQPTRLSVEIPQGARSGRFTLRGRFTVESRQRFQVQTVTNPPVVSSISPAEGPPGTRVTITGQRFASQTFRNRVTLSGQACIVRTASPTRLTVDVPTGAGSGPFVVNVTGGGEAASSQSFTVFSALAISSLTPTTGPPGTQVTIRGSGFVPSARDNRVTINGRPGRVHSATDTEIVFEIPRGATSGPVEVTARGNRRRARDPFRITTPPTVQRFAPTSGAPGTEVTIYGRNFGDRAHGFHVRLGGAECRIISVGPTQARVAIPEGAASGPFQVEVHAQGTADSSRSFTVFAPVTIGTFTPTRGPAGTPVTVRGTGFSPTLRNNKVLVGGRPARVTAAGETELRIEIPARLAGGKIRVQVRGRGTAESTREFVVMNAPVIARFSPGGGAPGTEVTLQGDHFGTSMRAVRVSLAGTPCNVTSVAPTRIVLRIPPRASSGTFQVAVGGQGTTESSSEFEVASPLTIAGFAPSGGGSGTEVTITGAGFSTRTRDNTVFLGSEAVTVLSARADELRVRIPATATTGRFRVQTAGRGEAMSRASFRVQVALGIDRVEPNRGQPGTEVRLIGHGLAHSGLRVLLAGRPVRHRGVSDSELVVTIPAGARSGPFVIRVPRMGEARSHGEFTVTDPPVLTAMSPTAGPPGTVVTLQGRGFSPLIPRNRARIGNAPLLVEAVSPTQMRVRIPNDATTGSIVVEVRDRGHATSARPFTVTRPAHVAAPPPPPTPPTPPTPPAAPTQPIVIQGFSPRSGPPNTMVQVLGDGFGTNPADIRVWIGAIQAPIVNITGRMMTIRVPANAQSAPLRIMRRGPGGGASAQTPVPFTVQR